MGKRRLKVYDAPGCTAINIPCIRLQGRWLEKLGFKPGNGLIIEESEGKITIELVKENSESYNDMKKLK